MILPDIDNLIFSLCDKSTQLILDITYPNKFFIDKFIYDDLCFQAAKDGHLAIVIWSKQNRYSYNNICLAAAENGHLDILIWARENGYECNARVFAFAALNGHLNILKYFDISANYLYIAYNYIMLKSKI